MKSRLGALLEAMEAQGVEWIDEFTRALEDANQ